MYQINYRFKIKSGMEHQFIQYWKDLTIEIRKNFKAIGSVLYYTENNEFSAMSIWRCREDWEQFWLLKEQILDTLTNLKLCLADPSETQGMHLVYSNLKFTQFKGAELSKEALEAMIAVGPNIEESYVIDLDDPAIEKQFDDAKSMQTDIEADEKLQITSVGSRLTQSGVTDTGESVDDMNNFTIVLEDED